MEGRNLKLSSFWSLENSFKCSRSLELSWLASQCLPLLQRSEAHDLTRRWRQVQESLTHLYQLQWRLTLRLAALDLKFSILRLITGKSRYLSLCGSVGILVFVQLFLICIQDLGKLMILHWLVCYSEHSQLCCHIARDQTLWSLENFQVLRVSQLETSFSSFRLALSIIRMNEMSSVLIILVSSSGIW